MNRLDERLKSGRQDCPIPQGFDGRMDAIWRGCRGRKKPGPRRLRQWAVVFWRRPCAWAAWRRPPARWS